MFFLVLQRAITTPSGSSMPFQSRTSSSRVPSSVQGTLLFRQRSRLHTRINEHTKKNKQPIP